MALCVAGAIAALLGFGTLQYKVHRLTGEINDLRAERSLLSASQPVMVMTIKDATSVIEEASRQTKLACNLIDSLNRDLKALPADSALARTGISLKWNTCTSPQDIRPVLARMQEPYFRAASARLSGDFRSAASLYHQSLNLIGLAQPDLVNDPRNADSVRGWTVRAWEGAAYSEFRLGDLTRAAQDIARAKPPTGEEFVFANTTALKILCRSRSADAASVKAMAVRSRKALDDWIARTSGKKLCYAKRDRKTFEEDQELFDACGSFGIKEMAVSGPSNCP